MEQEIQSQTPQPIDSVSPDNKNKIKSVLVFGVIMTIIILVIGAFLFVNKSAYNTSSNQTVSQTPETPTTNKTVYFGKGSQGKYSLVNAQTGETQEFIPKGYTIISQTEYQNFPTFLILQKDNDLFSYSVVNKITSSIFGSFNDLKIKQDEEARVYPSITEKDKFIIRIDKLDLSISDSYGGPPIISTRTYSFDASTNNLVSITKKINGCIEYDSKNERFFTWRCSPGDDTSLPLLITDLDGKEQKQVIALRELESDKYYPDSTKVKYQNGLFFAISGIFQIMVIDPQSINPTKEIYTPTEQIKSQITKTHPYSVSIDKNRNTIIIGSDNSILLLRFNTNKQIIQSEHIADKEIYANFIFVDEGKLYYQAKDNIRIVNLDTWQIDKSIASSENFQEITLFSNPN